MDDTPLELDPAMPASSYGVHNWYTPTRYAYEMDERAITVIAVLKSGLLPGWQRPSGRWLIPPEAATEEKWGKALRKFRTSPRSIAEYCATVFEMSASEQARLESVLVARNVPDPMAEVARLMFLGITASHRSVPRTIKRAVVERDGGRCVYCLTETDELEFDHVKPVSWGGHHTVDNIVLACKVCNRMKRAVEALPCESCDRLTWEVKTGRNRCGCRVPKNVPSRRRYDQHRCS